MFGDGYVGGTEDTLKIARYNKKREKEKQEFEVSNMASVAYSCMIFYTEKIVRVFFSLFLELPRRS